jgi:hypothetical protein
MAQCFDSVRRRRTAVSASLLLALVLVPVTGALAQVPAETAGGTRALGMGGAFTAVADDATAAWWNPAGLSTLLADAVIEGGSDAVVDDPGAAIAGDGAWRARPLAVSVAFPMLGVSFNHLSVNEIRLSSTAAAGPGRQDPAARIRSIGLSSVGVTLVQSLGDAVVVGSTVRLLRGGVASAAPVSGTTVDQGLDAARELDPEGRTVLDADVGVLAFAGPVRLALVGRNLGGHRFETGLAGEEPFRLERQVRVGAAFGSGPAWARRAWTLAADADLTTVHAADGDRRSLAVGGERWIGQAKRVAVRAGGRIQTIGEARPVASGGASVALMTGVYVEGQVSGGGDRAVNGWSLAARVTF